MEKRRIKTIFFLENLLYFGMIYIISKYILGIEEGFLNMNLHPLFILTGIMAYRYGVHLGIISATIASLIYSIYYIQLGKDFVVFFYDFKYFKFILMFYIFAFILGRIRDNKVEMEKNLTQEISTFKKNYQILHENNKKLIYINNRMKDEIIKSEESIISLYNISKDLDTLEVEKLITNIIGVFKTYINAESLSIYFTNRSKDYLRLAVSLGKNRKLPDSIKVDEFPEFQNAIENKKYGKRDGTSLETPVLYAPILDNGEVIGILNIERLSYNSYTKYTEKLFEILIEWTSKAISNARSYSEKMKQEIYYEDSNIMKKEFFDRRLIEEIKRGEMFETSYILLEFKLLVDDIKKINLPIRSIDCVGYDVNKKIINILFPATKIENRNLIKNKLLEKNIGVLEEYHEG
jgi:K+-sensing histidine kinase KdpD